MKGLPDTSPIDPPPDYCEILRSGYVTFKGNEQLFRLCSKVDRLAAACHKLGIIKTCPARPFATSPN
jgi:hypothetical protein